MLYRNFGVAAGIIALAVLVVTLIAIRSDGPTGTSAGGLVQGDTNCNQGIEALDALGALLADADIDPPADCLEAGDVDCDQDVDAADAVAILVHIADLSAAQIAGGCPAIGEPLPFSTPTEPGGTVMPTPVTITPTLVPTPTPPPPCAGPGGGASLPSDPGGSAIPQEDAYQLDMLLSAGYLGASAERARAPFPASAIKGPASSACSAAVSESSSPSP